MIVSIFDIINNMSFVGWFVIVTSFFAALFSWVVFWQDMSRRSSFFFFLFSILNVFWAFAYGAYEGSIGSAFSQTGIDILYSVAALMPIFFFLFLYLFSFGRNKVPLKSLTILFVPYLIIVFLINKFFGFIVISQSSGVGTGEAVVPGAGFWLYVVYFFAFFVAGVIVVINKYNQSAGIFKVAIRRLFIGVVLAYVVAATTSLLSPLYIGTYELFWVGHIAITLLVFVVGIILIKYNFWNLKIVTTELFLAVVVATMIIEIFFASTVGDLFIKTIITILILFSCAFLDGSIKRELRSRDKILSLSQDIDFISKRLKILDNKKSEFLTVASHHLRDPLTAIKGYASMLLSGSFGELPVRVRESLEKIFDSSERLIVMIADFMNISRIESGNMNYVFSNIDIKKLILGLVDEMKPSVNHAHLQLGVVVDNNRANEEPFMVYGDEGKLRQVFSNLIDNSIKYTPKGEISILLSKTNDGKKVVFSISDTGIGMNGVTKEKIFKKFSRAEGVSKVYTEGTGLGLYVAKEVVKKHEGRIWAESKGEGHGSTFYVELDTKR